LRTGHNDGPILVDLERRQPIALVPDREAGTVAPWLKVPPGVEVISRARAPAYAEAAHAGAPQAVQVADHWPLLKHMQEAGQRLMTRQHALSAQAATTVIARQLEPPIDPHGLGSMFSSREAKDVQRRRRDRR
jgi:hypothetical protein